VFQYGCSIANTEDEEAGLVCHAKKPEFDPENKGQIYYGG
jgi:hypothetical protein